MSPLSICIVDAPPWSGFSRLKRLLVNAGHRVTVLCEESRPPAESGVTIAELPSRLAYPTLSSKDSFRSYQAYEWLRSRDGEFDVVHLSSELGTGYFALTAKRQGLAFAKTVLAVHVAAMESTHRELQLHKTEDLERDFMEGRSVAFADTVIAESGGVLEGVARRRGWDLPASLTVIADEQRCLDWHSRAGLAGEEPVSSEGHVGTEPLVSVCVTHFNRSHYVRQAIGSVLAQSYPNCEVVLVDDASTDPQALECLGALEGELGPSRLRIVRHETNRYLGAARNTAARVARGDYLLFLDDDDLAKKDLVSTLVSVAERTRADVVTSFVDFFSSEGNPASGQRPDGRWIVLGPALSAGVFRNDFGCATALFRKSSFDELGGYTEDHGVGHEDWELYARAAVRGYRLEVVPEALVWYRKKPESMLASTSRYLNHMRHLRPYREEAMPGGLRELVEYGLGLHFLETELFEARERLARRTPTDLECMLIAGKSLYELGELGVANQVLASAFELAEATKNDAAVLDCLFSTTKVLVELEAYDAAKRALQMGLETARRTDDPGAIIQALLNAASAQHRAGEPEAGGAAVRQALDVAHRCGSPFALSQCSIGASEVYLEWGEHEKARALLEQSLHHARTLDDRVVRVRATGHLAKLWKELGDAQRAKTYAVEAIRLAEASNDESLLQRTRMGCAEVLTAIDETSLAVELLEETIRDATQAEDGVTVGRARFLVERVALPEKDRGEERRQTRTDTLAAAGARVTARARPRILLLADRPGWAFDVAAKAVARQLAHKYEFRISYVLRQPSLELWPFDAVHVFWWGETYHHRAGVEPSRVIKEIASYRWALEERYGCLTPEEAARTYLADARTLTTVSKRLQQTFAPHRDVLFVPNGYDPAVFHDRGARSGALRIGWAGNAADPCKGLEDILKPALTDGLELRIAGGGVRHRDMAEFYNSVDVLCVASTAEGEPLTLLEAMACGCYPVAVDVGMVPELVRHQENGLIVERRVDAFREAFSWCRDHVGLIRDAGRENSVLCRETRTWESVAEFWDRAFQTALDEQQQRDPAGDGRVNEREAAISGGAR